MTMGDRLLSSRTATFSRSMPPRTSRNVLVGVSVTVEDDDGEILHFLTLGLGHIVQDVLGDPLWCRCEADCPLCFAADRGKRGRDDPDHRQRKQIPLLRCTCTDRGRTEHRPHPHHPRRDTTACDDGARRRDRCGSGGGCCPPSAGRRRHRRSGPPTSRTASPPSIGTPGHDRSTAMSVSASVPSPMRSPRAGRVRSDRGRRVVLQLDFSGLPMTTTPSIDEADRSMRLDA